MGETAALSADEVLPALRLRQWLISFPFAPRFLFAAHPEALAWAPEQLAAIEVGVKVPQE